MRNVALLILMSVLASGCLGGATAHPAAALASSGDDARLKGMERATDGSAQSLTFDAAQLEFRKELRHVEVEALEPLRVEARIVLRRVAALSAHQDDEQRGAAGRQHSNAEPEQVALEPR